jgi:hypothetical protein
MIIKAALAALLAIFIVADSARAAEPAGVAVFPFELIDTSEEGELKGVNLEETRRLNLITLQLREAFAASNAYRLVDLSSQSARIDEKSPLHKCNDCEIDIARDAGADLSVLCNVQKVSNLILNINIYVKDVRSGTTRQVMSADIRGNTDETWTRGLRWLLRNRLMPEPQ